ncbi:LOW QUALITY PROTEIN: hypothetical protein HID58_022733 [Brassica napus]|uniref:DUF7950 domain-containing protein n=1 Tax=Brassica napus TaxID=3708 RepID=A0ABQ8D044_BRANA|nr:LOW QUALITY PROTEIN: hypothetical protein HID58_022733 [Brassica napus]
MDGEGVALQGTPTELDGTLMISLKLIASCFDFVPSLLNQPATTAAEESPYPAERAFPEAPTFPLEERGNVSRRRTEVALGAHGGEAKVTLSLLPERPGQSAFTDMKLSVASAEKQKRQGPFWLSLSDGGGMITQTYQSVEVMGRTVVISSCMTVERVTDAWNDGYGLGRSDEERKMNLVRDTCPGFISDGSGAPENKSGESFHVIVRLVMRERPMLTYTAFTCRMTLQFTCQDRERCSVTVPCDVWRMDDGR